jgi:predicted ArsR family transcriptional regulator
MQDSVGQRSAQDTGRPEAGRLRILQLLQESPAPLGVQDLAKQVGLHPNTVRFHLVRLARDGLVQRHSEARTTPGRPRFTYAAENATSDQRSYRLLAKILASFMTEAVPDAARAATSAGRSWGRYLTERPAPYSRTNEQTTVATLVDALDTMGFAPEPTADGKEIHLRNCPFREVADENLQVVCAVHLGIMQGVLEELRSPVTATRLEPFVEPQLCVAHLGKARRRRTNTS